MHNYCVLFLAPQQNNIIANPHSPTGGMPINVAQIELDKPLDPKTGITQIINALRLAGFGNVFPLMFYYTGVEQDLANIKDRLESLENLWLQQQKK